MLIASEGGIYIMGGVKGLHFFFPCFVDDFIWVGLSVFVCLLVVVVCFFFVALVG